MTGWALAVSKKGQVSLIRARAAAAGFGVSGEAVGGQGFGDGVQRRSEGPLPVSAGHLIRQPPAVLLADRLGHGLGVSHGHQRQRPAEQEDQEVVGAVGTPRPVDRDEAW